ncbi:MAG TPA: hypothetical protein VFV19_13260 [Candidatus Polarisedimenticolaceae bacterium]|nr:hypothetical protein [Candidatus Polarisedimenticolaceae bacterium]
MPRIVAFALLVLAAALPGPPPASKEASARWVVVDYGPLVDRRKLTHSGDSVGTLLDQLGGRPRPPLTDHTEDALAHRLLDPILEPYAFVLPDALDSLSPPPDPPLVEVGPLWDTGDPQPAWVELARARRLLLESDGEGHLRAILPSPGLEALPFSEAPPAATDPVAAAREAWQDAWPVLRHALAGERKRRQGDVEVSVYAYRHAPERSKFLLGTEPWKTTVRDTAAPRGTVPLDLAALSSMLEKGRRIEGGKIEDGRVRWFTSEPDSAPVILGRPTSLADLAVAYRSIAHGGYGEPYMSLERAVVPQIAVVNYGGRLRDTALGMVSLLADVRFKTFSVGIDLLGPGDVRDSVRKTLPGFRTHLERFAADPTAGAVMNQQTRLWFRPDDVDLTLSPEQDVCAFRRARMTAISERVRDAADETTAAEPAWTKATTAFINAHYDEMSQIFPEMSELNETVRWLSVFAWLESARAHGVAVPDLDMLMGVELPALPTPRRFPQLLSYDVLPRAGGEGVVDVLDRTAVGTALDRLEPVDGRALPPAVRFRRDRALLDPSVPDQAALAARMDALGSETDAVTLDLYSFRAERLLMHARILASLSAPEAKAVAARRSSDPDARIFSIGIGGVDLGTNAILARAIGRSSKMGLGSIEAAPPSRATAPPSAATAPQAEAVASAWPDHGLGAEAERTTTALPGGRGSIVARSRPGSIVRKGSWKLGEGRTVAWEEWILGMEGTEARFRRRTPDVEGRAPVFERLEDGRLLSYRFDRSGAAMKAATVLAQLPEEAFGAIPAESADPAPVPAGLALLDVAPSASAPTPGRLTAITLRLRDAERDRTADVPGTLLQRLVLGRAFDPTPDRPLAAFTPAKALLGSARTLMVMATAAEGRPPWSVAAAPEPGETDAARIATALTAWWRQEAPPEEARAVVGVHGAGSLARFAAAPRFDGKLAVDAGADAFPALPAASRSGISALPPGTPGARVVLVVSGEGPGVLGRHLRRVAADPSNAGKALAVVALAGAPRDDLPASLLGEGKLAAIGIYSAGPVGIPEAVDRVSSWARAAADAKSTGLRLEELPGPFTWYY